MLLVTGGAGFIGSNFVLGTIAETGEHVVNLDKLTYAGNRRNLAALEGDGGDGSGRGDARHIFVHGDICDRSLVKQLFSTHRPRAVIHFAAESHVDRSIHSAEEFVQTNVVGTFSLLEEACAYWKALPEADKAAFRFVNVSTDEVYGSLEPGDAPFTEDSVYRPNSPYSASKAAADHFARAFRQTHGLPVITTNCSNNYGPFQFPEKLIPLMIHRALSGEALPVYGDGRNIRDWLYVEDHCRALRVILEKGRPGETYCIGGENEIANIDLVRLLCAELDSLRPRNEGKDGKGGSYADRISFVRDRPGHDHRYAIDAGKIRTELGWQPEESFETGLRKTLRWYLAHEPWVQEVVSGAYRSWVGQNYAARGAAVKS